MEYSRAVSTAELSARTAIFCPRPAFALAVKLHHHVG
jgi:hypothetical protein